MSWLFNSNYPHPSSPPSADGGSSVKDEISLFRGVANFLAPPPSSHSRDSSASASSALSPASSVLSSSQTLTGIRNDLAEISGSFKNSISLLSSNKAITGISKFASQLFHSQHNQRRRQLHHDVVVPGTTDEVVRFVKEIATQPQCWTEFPLPLHNDFSMSSSQREHALAIEEMVPEFVALRQSLCSYMNVEKFWMIYFLLILPRLNQHDLECLSTPKIVEARDVLLSKLEEGKKLQARGCGKTRTLETSQEGREDSGEENISFEQNQDLTEVTNATKVLQIDDMTEKWFEDTDIDATSLTSGTKVEHEEDVSFSDLDDVGSYSSDKLLSHRESQDIRGSSPEGCSDWVKLHGTTERRSMQKAVHSKGKDSEDESNDWLSVDEFN